MIEGARGGPIVPGRPAWSHARKVSAAALLFFSLFIIADAPSRAGVESSVSGDGTVHFFNRATVRKNTPARLYAVFKSPHVPLIKRIAAEEGVDPWLVQCIVKVESDFRADAVSVSGAMGLMQLMQEVARYYKVERPFDPEENIRAGVRHFKSLLRYFKGEVPLALAAYHAGLGTVRKHNAVPPIRETVAYVRRVMGLYDPSGTSGDGSTIEGGVKKLYKKIRKDGTLDIYSR